MLTLAFVLLLGAEPDRFLGGAAPTPLSVPGPVNARASLQACSTQSLRSSSKCFFDGRPAVSENGAEKKKRAKDNVELARGLGQGLCTERLDPALDAKEKTRRLTLCLAGTGSAAASCSLEGAELLLDAEGRFSTQARACYEALAAALQSAEVPPAPKAEPAAAPAPKSRFPVDSL